MILPPWFLCRPWTPHRPFSFASAFFIVGWLEIAPTADLSSSFFCALWHFVSFLCSGLCFFAIYVATIWISDHWFWPTVFIFYSRNCYRCLSTLFVWLFPFGSDGYLCSSQGSYQSRSLWGLLSYWKHWQRNSCHLGQISHCFPLVHRHPFSSGNFSSDLFQSTILIIAMVPDVATRRRAYFF